MMIIQKPKLCTCLGQPLSSGVVLEDDDVAVDEPGEGEAEDAADEAGEALDVIVHPGLDEHHIFLRVLFRLLVELALGLAHGDTPLVGGPDAERGENHVHDAGHKHPLRDAHSVVQRVAILVVEVATAKVYEHSGDDEPEAALADGVPQKLSASFFTPEVLHSHGIGPNHGNPPAHFDRHRLGGCGGGRQGRRQDASDGRLCLLELIGGCGHSAEA